MFLPGKGLLRCIWQRWSRQTIVIDLEKQIKLANYLMSWRHSFSQAAATVFKEVTDRDGVRHWGFFMRAEDVAALAIKNPDGLMIDIPLRRRFCRETPDILIVAKGAPLTGLRAFRVLHGGDIGICFAPEHLTGMMVAVVARNGHVQRLVEQPRLPEVYGEDGIDHKIRPRRYGR